jgi:anti-sigma28 factor (negative regulator of flagellin synthesis)
MRQTMRERSEAKREEKLAEIRGQVADGSLTIRTMTAEERLRYATSRPAAHRPRRAR